MDHEATCPTISPVHCEQAEAQGNPIPSHQHHQEVLFATISSNLLYSFNDQWQIGMSLPFQYRNIGIRYSLTDTGENYTPPYAGLHHRNETLYGLGDAEAYAQRFFTLDSLTVGIFFGSTIPIGKTEEDPYALAVAGQEHQHFQMGTGIFVPTTDVTVFYRQEKQGWIGKVRGEYSLYENDKFYKTGSAFRWDAGYWRVLSPRVLLLGQVKGDHEQPDTWRGLTAPFSGRHALSGAISNTVRIRSNWELLFRAEQLLWVHSIVGEIEEEGGDFPLYTKFSFGVSWM